MAKKKSSPTVPANHNHNQQHNKVTNESKNGSKVESVESEPTAACVQENPQGKIEKSLCPIVGIGASAGGLEAFKQLLERLPIDTGMAFVLIQHLDPRYESMLTSLLAKATKLPVSEVKDNTQVEPNHVYVIPPNMDMTISNAVLKLTPRARDIGPHLSIDHFLRSLAEDQKSRAIGVILSGAASDGSLGLMAIKGEGGLTFAQDKESAKYGDMPNNAVAAGCVDFVLPPAEIAKELARIGHHPFLTECQKLETGKLLTENENGLKEICILLRNNTRVDFTYYKYATINRRVIRRMILHKIDTLDDYIAYLKTNSKEVEDLYQDILINVTNFFRDPESFQSLKDNVFPAITSNKTTKSPIRIWVAGCSTGEEVYSIAICLLEFLGENSPIQIFATDISELSIKKARAGIYPESIALDVSPQRLERFFVKIDTDYQICKFIRDMCVFAKQDLTKDTPFSKLDLISCRNVMIYLEPILQKKIIPTFHYSLNPKGFLMLGRSETVGTSSDLFSVVDKKNKIYSKNLTKPKLNLNFTPIGYTLADRENSDEYQPKRQIWREPDVRKEADRLVMAKYAPAGVVINNAMEIIQFRGQTGAYLEPAPGDASLNLLKMVRGGLLLELRTAIHEAKREGISVRKTDLDFKFHDKLKTINLEVIPIHNADSKKTNFLILFEDTIPPEIPELELSSSGAIKSLKQFDKTKQQAAEKLILKLEQELAATKEYLQSIIEDQEAANEDLRAASEEVESSNEELQSTNEELETAKEELQSANEELITVNEELQNRNHEFSLTHNDLTNLLSSVDIPILMLDSDLRIRRFTPMAEKALKVIPGDIGRHISDIRLNIVVSELEKAILEVIKTLKIHEQEIQDSGGRWYSMQIRPYKTMENKIEGAVLVLIDIDALKRSLEQITIARNYAEAIVETVHEPLIVLDANLRVETANKAFYQFFQIPQPEREKHTIFELDKDQQNIPELQAVLKDLLPKNVRLQDFQIDCNFDRIGHKTLLLNAHPIYTTEKNKNAQKFLLALDDITERNRLFTIEKEARVKAEAAERRSALLAEASAMMAGLLDYQTTLAQVPHLAVPNFADWCVIDILEPDKQLRQMEVVHTDPSKEQLVRNLRQESPFDLNAEYCVSNVLRTANPELMIEIPDSYLIANATNDKHLKLLRELHPKSSIVVPLITRGKTIGTITFVLSESERCYSPADLVFAEDLAFRTALAVDNSLLYKEAQEANRIKDEFLATVSHELRTPLTAILGWTRILRMEKFKSEESFLRSVNTIERNANAQAKLIEDLVDVSRIVSGKLRLDLSRVEFALIVKTAINSIQLIADAKPVEIQCQLSLESGIIFGDLDRLQQIVSNLLSNAIKFTPAGGCIKVHLEEVDSFAKLTISDNGIGISREFLPHVFDRFRQSDSSSVRLHSGLGLGLSIVRHLVELHGGSIQAESKGERHGSTFTLLLPLMPNQVSEGISDYNREIESEHLSNASLELKGLRALIVDDEPDTLNMLASMLRQYGVEVKTSASVSEAMAVMANWLPNVLVSDIAMPGENGHELIRKVRLLEPEQGGTIPAIALTSYTRQEDKLEAISAGFQMHLPKPINIDHLRAAIAGITGRQNRRQPAIN